MCDIYNFLNVILIFLRDQKRKNENKDNSKKKRKDHL